MRSFESRALMLGFIQNFEFPGPASIEWYDGTQGDGGTDIVSLALRRDHVLIRFARDLEIDVSFRLDNAQFAELHSFLTRMLDEHVFTTTIPKPGG